MFRGSSFTFAVLAIFSFVSTVSGDVITFESLPVNSGGYYNGDTSATSPLRDNYSSIGTGSNFGATEHLQQWTIGGVSFNNNYTPDFDSWTGWSWSNVANIAGREPAIDSVVTYLPSTAKLGTPFRL